nr:hypothetical protein [Tanacetum cinerariifolium]
MNPIDVEALCYAPISSLESIYKQTVPHVSGCNKIRTGIRCVPLYNAKGEKYKFINWWLYMISEKEDEKHTTYSFVRVAILPSSGQAVKQRALLRATIEKNKVEADRQFAEIPNALKALQPPTTLPATIPCFEENSRQSFSSVEVEKEGKDIGFLGALVTRLEVADGHGGENIPQTDSILKNLNSKDISTCIGFDLRTFEGLHCDLGMGHERRT